MRPLGISVWKTVFHTRKVKQANVSWDDFALRLKRFTITPETHAEYLAMPTAQQLALKDSAGFFIGGRFAGSQRLQDKLLYRDLVCLDCDHLPNMDELLDLQLAYADVANVIHSSHKHSDSSPRLRLIVPTDRQVKPHEYPALARALADRFGMDYWDDTTYQPSRVMFYASCSSDGDQVYHVNEAEPLAVDELLATLDVEDPMTWPLSSREKAPMVHGKGVEDPLGKPGVVGAFCRAYYPIQSAIAEFELPYEEVTETRYTFEGGTSAEGAVVYDDHVHLFSNHESDPAYGHNRNAFDLVMLHKFGDDEDWDGQVSDGPNFQQMVLLAMDDEQVAKELDIDASEEFEDVSEVPTTPVDPTRPEKDPPDNVVELKLVESPFAKMMGEVQAAGVLSRDAMKKKVARANLLTLSDVDVDLLASAIREQMDPKPKKSSLVKLLMAGRTASNVGDLDRLLCDELLKEFYNGGHHLKRVAKLFWSWEAGYWAQLDDEIVMGNMMNTITRLRQDQPDDKALAGVVADTLERRTSAISEGVGKVLRNTLATREKRDDPLHLLDPVLKPRINTESGLIQFDYDGTWEMLPHDPDDFLTWKVNCRYDAAADCPLFDDFLQHIYRDCLDPEGMVRHTWELIGYIINDSRWLKVWVLLHGETNTGKSTLLKVLQALLGGAALSQEMAAYGTRKNQFTEGGLLGKLLLADDDFDKAGSLPDGLLKKISEEKQITTEIKFGGLVSFLSRVVPLICANHRPVTRDVSSAFRDRALVIDFLTPFEGAERSDQTRDAMLRELPGMLNGAVAGLSRLRARGGWDTPIDGAAAHRNWERNSNAIMVWMDECTTKTPGVYMSRADAWRSFDRWSRESHTLTMKKSEFFERLVQVLGPVATSDGVRGWHGYRISDGSVVDPAEEFGDGDT